ncbi:MAG: hypothetical protein HYY17_00500 [Planctomycetes bacterium]|nr:hypothetical protein [Planctomycetota bacterium]
MNLGAILLTLAITVVVKLAVMVLGFRLILRLYGATAASAPKRLWILLPREHWPEVRVLRWALVLFFLSELTCGVEIYILFRSHPLLSGTHAVVSGIATGLFALGLFLYFDKKWLQYGGSACLGNRVCRGCTFRAPESCKFRTVLLLLATFVALAAVPPLFAPTARMYADPKKYILPFPALNAWYDRTAAPWLQAHFPNYSDPSAASYSLPPSMWIIEFRILPCAAALLAVAGIALLLRRREVAGLRFVASALGVLGYVYLEVVLYPATGETLIGSLGHEVAELWFLIATAEFLRRAFPPEAAT